MFAPKINDLAELARLGAEARARGDGVLSNPFLQHDAMPERTGDDLTIWGAKMQAWASGWRGGRGAAPHR